MIQLCFSFMESDLPANKVFLTGDKRFADAEDTADDHVGDLPLACFRSIMVIINSCFHSLAAHSSGFYRPQHTQAAWKFGGQEGIPPLLLWS